MKKKTNLFIRLLSTLLATILLSGVFSSPVFAQTATLRLDRYSFQPGEEIKVHFTASANYAANAWVGIVPSHIPHGEERVNDQHDIAYQYLNKRSGGTLIFRAPSNAGGYDFRMHDTDNMGKEVCFIGFRVETGKGKGKPVLPKAAASTLRLDRYSFQPGEEIKVHFTAPANYAANAWVGIVPSHIPHGDERVNDQHDIVYQYLNKRSGGTLIFRAPANAGGYDFRMHDTDNMGKEVCFVGFRVEAGKGLSKVAPIAGGKQPGQSVKIVDTMNIATVYNKPTAPTAFSISRPHRITHIVTYHWNNARGAAPGTIALRAGNGKVYGPWKASTRQGQGGVPNAYWEIWPNVVIPAGKYTIIDSDPGTWSQNRQSGGRGMAEVQGTPHS